MHPCQRAMNIWSTENMNIQQAISQLESTIRAYTAETEEGVTMIPIEAQRPIYLEGPPGIGKTAIMEQIARNMKIGLVSYTMTHHTRQSTLGLPVIKECVFKGRKYSITEYTMSEIVAEIYRCMELTGCSSGILFLDEINCVSETLMPVMLELLQHKRFGKHRLPEKWVIVCAGNPEKYNRNARSFDAVTLDRVRLMRIEPDVDAWQNYAAQIGVHPAVRAYLRLRPEDFYIAEGNNIVTPRSWCDLSGMICALETAGENPDGLLFEQYLQCESICERFSLYYAMCENVARNFQLDRVLFEGDISAAEHFAVVPFDEALCCAEMLSQRLSQLEKAAARTGARAKRLKYFFDAAISASDKSSPAQVCQKQLERQENALRVRKNAGVLSPEEEGEENALYGLIRETIAAMMGSEDPLKTVECRIEEAFVHAATLEKQYLSAKENIRVFGDTAFHGDSFQVLLCRSVLKI